MIKKYTVSLLVLFLVVSTGIFAQGKVLPGYDGMFQGNYLIEPIDLHDKNSTELGFLRNEIFAKYGREFNTQKYRDYFSAKKWYKVNPGFQDSFLSSADNKNIEMILSFEKPALSESAARQKVLDNLEYRGQDGNEIVFSDEEYLIYHEGGADRGFYGDSSQAWLYWEVTGNWIHATQETPDGLIEIFLLLDHTTQRIIEEYMYQE